MAESLSNSIDSLRIQDEESLKTGTHNSEGEKYDEIARTDSTSRMGDQMEENARDYFDETSFSIGRGIPQEGPSSASSSKSLKFSRDSQTDILIQSTDTDLSGIQNPPESNIHGGKETSLPLPSKTRFVRSNGSPYGTRTASERSIIGPSLSPIQGSDDEDEEEEAALNIEKDSDIYALDGVNKNDGDNSSNSSTELSSKNGRVTYNSSPSSSTQPRRTSREFGSDNASQKPLINSSPHISSPYASLKQSSRCTSSQRSTPNGISASQSENRGNSEDAAFDNIKEALSKGRMSAVSTRAPQSRLSKEESPSAFLSFNGDTVLGLRAKETEKRKLETENLELKMKLQQYREMNSGENEMAKMQHELSRAEKRIDELELALERKNGVIEDLTNDKELAIQASQEAFAVRDEEQSRADGLYSVIDELQNMISDLEKADKKLLDRAHSEFPDILPENPDISQLLGALRNTVEENATLTKVSALASSLKAQNNHIMGAVRDSGRKGDPVQIIRELTADVVTLRRREQELLQSLDQSDYSRRELEAMVTRLEETSKEAKSHSYALIQNFFAELFDIMGDDFQGKVELELKQIVERSMRESVSKIPPLTDLMVSYTRKIAEMAVSNKTATDQEQKIALLESQNQSLEHLIELKMDKLRADNVLRAQIRDLQRQVKRLNELRQIEWKEYERVLKKA